MYITLRCRDCENTQCSICPKGNYIAENDMRGCTRQVSIEEAARYQHYLQEIAPFMYMATTKEYQNTQYKNIIDFLYYIYTRPIGQKLNKNGKVSQQ